MRLELQHQLHTSEGKLHQLQQGIGSYVSNGPSTETHDGASTLCKRERETERDREGEREEHIKCISSLKIHFLLIIDYYFADQRETLVVQMPKGSNARKNGWKDVVSV